MADLNFANFSTVQNQNQPKPNTIAAAATIAPSTFLTYVSGTTDLATITAPVTGQHLILLSFTHSTPGDVLTTGNVLVGTTLVAQYSIVVLVYDPALAKYHCKLLA